MGSSKFGVCLCQAPQDLPVAGSWGTCPNVRRRHALCREHGPEQARVREPALAHPEFRDELTAAAKAMYLI
jgi:hypothetical protein